jgi:hypothetical protein
MLTQVENQAERVVYRSQLVKGEMPHAIAQASGVNRADHLAQHPRRLAFQHYLGMKGGRRSRAGGRTDDRGREREQIVRLDNDREARSVLDVTPSAGELDRVHVTPDHVAPPSAR